jgi:hypothetical protein
MRLIMTAVVLWGLCGQCAAAAENTQSDGKMARAVDKTERAVKHAAVKTGEAVGKAADKTGKAVKKAAVKTGQALEKTGQKIEGAFKD